MARYGGARTTICPPAPRRPRGPLIPGSSSRLLWDGAPPGLAESWIACRGARTCWRTSALCNWAARHGAYRIAPEQPLAKPQPGSPLSRLASGSHTLETRACLHRPWSHRQPALPASRWRPRQFLTTCFLAAAALRRRLPAPARTPGRRTRMLRTRRRGAWTLSCPESRAEGRGAGFRFRVARCSPHGGFASVMSGYDRQRKQRCHEGFPPRIRRGLDAAEIRRRWPPESAPSNVVSSTRTAQRHRSAYDGCRRRKSSRILEADARPNAPPAF